MKIIIPFKILLVSVLLGSYPLNSGANIEVAITVDDLPARGAETSVVDWVKTSDEMIGIFKKHNIRGVYGFVNSKPLFSSGAATTDLRTVLTH